MKILPSPYQKCQEIAVTGEIPDAISTFLRKAMIEAFKGQLWPQIDYSINMITLDLIIPDLESAAPKLFDQVRKLGQVSFRALNGKRECRLGYEEEDKSWDGINFYQALEPIGDMLLGATQDILGDEGQSYETTIGVDSSGLLSISVVTEESDFDATVNVLLTKRADGDYFVSTIPELLGRKLEGSI